MQDGMVMKATPADLVNTTQKTGIPVIQDDASRPTALEAAGIAKARAIVLCSQNDALNLKIALKARSLNPDVKVIIRIFDDDFADALQAQFGRRNAGNFRRSISKTPSPKNYFTGSRRIPATVLTTVIAIRNQVVYQHLIRSVS